MEEIKQIYKRFNDRDESQKEETTSQLISFQCMICLNEFDNNAHSPILICENQHNMCKRCVHNKNFKKSLVRESAEGSQRSIQSCPMCNEQIDQTKLRKNNLLIEIYSWIQNVSKRQNQKIQTLQRDFKQVEQQHKKNLLYLNQKNEQLQICIETLSKENRYLKENLNLQGIEHGLGQIDEQKLIQTYEKLLQQLKKKRDQSKAKQLRVIAALTHEFEIDTAHKHFQKFKLEHGNCIQMQGPFYRAIFQSLNFYYNVMSTKSVKYEDFEYEKNLIVKYEFEILQTKRGHIYFGLSSKEVALDINPSSSKDFVGIFAEDCQIMNRMRRISTELSKNRPKSYKGLNVQIVIKKETTVFKVNGWFVYELRTETMFYNIPNRQLFPIVSMQMVGDKVRIVKSEY